MPPDVKRFWERTTIVLGIVLFALVITYAAFAGLKPHVVILALAGSGELLLLYLVVRDGVMRTGGKIITFAESPKKFVVYLWMIVCLIVVTLGSSALVHFKVLGKWSFQ